MNFPTWDTIMSYVRPLRDWLSRQRPMYRYGFAACVGGAVVMLLVK